MIMQAFEGDQTLMRIFIGERDKHEGRPLFEVLVDLFRKRDFPGTTVLRGIAGFGAHARIHTERILRLSLDLPVILEVVAPDEKIREILPELDRLIDGGLVTLEKAHVILYRPHESDLRKTDFGRGRA
jgi:PII-like signaling protein